MNLRTLYLKTSFSFSGRHSLGGRQLYDQFRSISDDCLLCHMVLPDEEVIKYSSFIYMRNRINDDIFPISLVKSFDPNLIYVEGGLFTESNLDISQENEPSHTSFKEGQWKIPREFVEELVANGAVIIIADVGWIQWYHQKSFYRTASDFFRAWAYYGREDKVRTRIVLVPGCIKFAFPPTRGYNPLENNASLSLRVYLPPSASTAA